MDWAIVIFLVVAGTTVGSLSWWSASEAAKAGRDPAPREGTTPAPWSTPRDISGNVLWGPRTR